MASSSITLYDENTGTTVYALASQSGTKTVYLEAGRSLAKPKSITVERKLSANGSSANDHIIVTVSQTEASTIAPFKLQTFSAKLDVSIPRDLTGFASGNTTDLLKRLSNLTSLLNHKVAMNVANSANTELQAIISGMDV